MAHSTTIMVDFNIGNTSLTNMPHLTGSTSPQVNSILNKKYQYMIIIFYYIDSCELQNFPS